MKKQLLFSLISGLAFAVGAAHAAAPRAGDLGRAAYAGDVTRVQELIDRGADVNEQAPNGETALMIAAANGHVEVVQVLIAADADVDARELNSGGTVLKWAKVNVVQALIDAGADVNARDDKGYTPLVYAAKKGMADVVHALLAAKEIDVNAQNNRGNTALSRAAYCGHTFVVQLLLQNGADPTIPNNSGRIAEDFVAKTDEIIIQMLRQAVEGPKTKSAGKE